MSPQKAAYDSLVPQALLEIYDHAKMRNYICLPAAESFSLAMAGLLSTIPGRFALASKPQATKTESEGVERSRNLQRHAQKLHDHGS
jgi:hypothetical protein